MSEKLALSLFDYDLPPERIAQKPAEPRDHSRLLVFDRQDGEIKHCHFYDLPEILNPGDLLIVNRTAVIPARLRLKKTTGGKVEMLCVRPLAR